MILVLHGILMMIAWLILVPAGIVVARYFKVSPSQNYPEELDNPFWFYTHVYLQSTGVAIACIGLAMAWCGIGTVDTHDNHARMGWIVMTLGFLQIVSSLLRGTKGGPTGGHAEPDRPETWHGDHYNMTLRRRLFEVWHKAAGYISVALAVPTAMLGLARAGFDGIVYVLPALLGLSFFGLWTYLQHWHRRVPTYQSIWGPDARHPGNRKSHR